MSLSLLGRPTNWEAFRHMAGKPLLMTYTPTGGYPWETLILQAMQALFPHAARSMARIYTYITEEISIYINISYISMYS